MQLVVGLGNPGVRFAKTRHNSGFLLVEQYQKMFFKKREWVKKEKFGALISQEGDIILAKPTVFVNASGESVHRLVDFYKIKPHNLYIAYDDLDIPLGRFKIQPKGPKEHKGIVSIEKALGYSDFWHIRIGIENRKDSILGRTYVLSNFDPLEQKIIAKVIKQAAKSLNDKLTYDN